MLYFLQQMPEDLQLDYAEITSIPPLPLWTLLVADKERPGHISTKQETKVRFVLMILVSNVHQVIISIRIIMNYSMETFPEKTISTISSAPILKVLDGRIVDLPCQNGKVYRTLDRDKVS
jgi:hypothetical protein